MEFFKQNTNIDFMGIRKYTGFVSIVLILGSIAFLAINGLNWGIDFTGGYQVQVSYKQSPNLSEVKKDLVKAGIKNSEVITFGSAKDIMIRLLPQASQEKQSISVDGQTEQQKLQVQVQSALGQNANITAVNYIGPEVGEELATNGLLAIIVALICIIAYIAFRFELKFALSAGIALLHDPIVILGVFAALHLEFDLTSLAAILAVIGYSLNDTVVIYDRVRENFRKMRKASVTEVMNRSVNDTLSRTIMTSGLTLIVVVVLFFLGGPSIHEFSLALILGVIVGTYSSIYVAGTLAVLFGLRRESLLPPPKIQEGHV
ncbi:protein translocase subunit SecF [Francisellaceae bacterium]|nr:protein translocase subunit SecF [Francisellaceae bacterium]